MRERRRGRKGSGTRSEKEGESRKKFADVGEKWAKLCGRERERERGGGSQSVSRSWLLRFLRVCPLNETARS